MLKNNFTDRKHFIRHYQRNGLMDFSELQAIDSLYNEGNNNLRVCLSEMKKEKEEKKTTRA